MKIWDCVVVGAGPAGLSAAVYMARFRRSTLVLDDAGGRWTYGQVNENYLGFPKGVRARRLHALGRAQAERFGAELREATVTAIARTARGYRLRAGRQVVNARTVIWAAGVKDRWPAFRGARRLVGRHLFWCIVCDGWRTRGRKVLVVGAEEKAASTALQFLTYTRHVTFLADPGPWLSGRCRGKLSAGGIPTVCGRIRSVRAGDTLEEVTLDDGTVLGPDFIFSLYGSDPRTEVLRGLPVALARNGHVRTDGKGATSLPGFFAAGDVTNRHSHQVASAVFEGAAAALAANHRLYPPQQRI